MAALLALAACSGLFVLRYTLLCPYLGRMVLKAGGQPDYHITDDDLLQLARAGEGEAGGRNPIAIAAVLWALANHYMRMPNKRRIYPTLGAFVRAYSTPLHAGRPYSTRAWDALSLVTRETTTRWAHGCVPSPVGSRTDWRAASAGYNPGDALNVGGNVFGTNEQAVAARVRIA
jgi:hypothetical protein